MMKLPPFELLLPECNIAIEIQGPSRYVDRDLAVMHQSC